MSTTTEDRRAYLTRGMPLDQFAAEIRRREEAKLDFVADTRRLGFTTIANGASRTMLFADTIEGEFLINDYAHAQVAERLKVPKTYYDRMRKEAPELLDANVRHWFINAPENRMVRTLDGNVRAFLSDRYRPMDDFGLFNALLPVFRDFPGIEFRDLAMTDTHTYVKTVYPDLVREIKVGEPVRSGCIIKNSEVGAGALVVAPYVDVLSCLNGMVLTQYAERKTHVGRRIDVTEANSNIFSDSTLRLDEQAYFAKAADLVRACFVEEQFEKMVEGLRELTELEIGPAPVKAVEVIAKKHLTEIEGGDMLRHLAAGGDLSAWGYVQSITRLANDEPDADRRTELQELGGTLASLNEKEWAALVAA